MVIQVCHGWQSVVGVVFQQSVDFIGEYNNIVLLGNGFDAELCCGRHQRARRIVRLVQHQVLGDSRLNGLYKILDGHLPTVGSRQHDSGDISTGQRGTHDSGLIARREDNGMAITGQCEGCRLESNLCPREDQDVGGLDQRTVELGDLLAEIERATVGSVAQRVVVVFVDQLMVSTLRGEVNEFLLRQRLGVGIGETVFDAALVCFGDCFVFFTPGIEVSVL